MDKDSRILLEQAMLAWKEKGNYLLADACADALEGFKGNIRPVKPKLFD